MRRGVKAPLAHIQAALAFFPIAHNEAISTASALQANLIIVQRDKLLIIISSIIANYSSLAANISSYYLQIFCPIFRLLPELNMTLLEFWLA